MPAHKQSDCRGRHSVSAVKQGLCSQTNSEKIKHPKAAERLIARAEQTAAIA